VTRPARASAYCAKRRDERARQVPPNEVRQESSNKDIRIYVDHRCTESVDVTSDREQPASIQQIDQVRLIHKNLIAPQARHVSTNPPISQERPQLEL
jgi:hypothetical protein